MITNLFSQVSKLAAVKVEISAKAGVSECDAMAEVACNLAQQCVWVVELDASAVCHLGSAYTIPTTFGEGSQSLLQVPVFILLFYLFNPCVLCRPALKKWLVLISTVRSCSPPIASPAHPHPRTLQNTNA
jgi:hypothetical protein